DPQSVVERSIQPRRAGRLRPTAGPGPPRGGRGPAAGGGARHGPRPPALGRAPARAPRPARPPPLPPRPAAPPRGRAPRPPGRAQLPTTIPARLTAGDTWRWRSCVPWHPPSEGWSLSYVLRGPEGKVVTATGEADGDDAWIVTVVASVTEECPAGTYAWSARV